MGKLFKLPDYHSYKKVPSFAPTKGVIVVDKMGAGIITTCPSVIYYELVEESVKALENMSLQDIATVANTSEVYAAIIKERLLAKFSKQLSLVSESEEFVFGIVRTGGDRFFAIGHRTIIGKPRRKISKETTLRQSLPIGMRAVYPLTTGAIVHKAVNEQGTTKTLVRKHVGISDMVTVKTPNVIIIADSEYYRKYGGRSFLARKAAWDKWDPGGELDDATVIIVRQKYAFAMTKEELLATKPSVLYPDYIKDMYTYPDLSAVVKVLDPILYKNIRTNVSVYVTDYILDGGKKFSDYVRFIMGSKVLSVRWAFFRSGMSGDDAMRTLNWHVGKDNYQNNSTFASYHYENYKLKDVMSSVPLAFEPIAVGVGVSKDRLTAYMPNETMTVGEIAEQLGVEPGNILVPPSKDTVPPYLFGRGKTLMLTPRNIQHHAIAGVAAEESMVLAKDTKFRVINGDLSLLLASA